MRHTLDMTSAEGIQAVNSTSPDQNFLYNSHPQRNQGVPEAEDLRGVGSDMGDHMKTNRTRSLLAVPLALLTLWMLAPQALAGIPLSIMTYQGRLKEAGLPGTGVRSVQINLCDALTAGSCVPSPWQNVSVANGLFRTTFSVSGVDLSAKALYLEVMVGLGSVAPTITLSPREELTASPYALYSTSATTLVAGANPQGAVISTNLFIVNGGSVGIGTTNPLAKLHVSSGSIILEGDVAISTGSTSGGSHLRSFQPTSPSATAPNPNCGTGAPTAIVNGTDMAGTVTLNTVTAPTGGCTVIVSFVRPYTTAPKAVVITPMGPNSHMLNASINPVPTIGGFVIQTNAAVAATTAYSWSYIVIE